MTGPRLQFATITLDRGWRARILTQCHEVPRESPLADLRPDLDSWRHSLNAFLGNPAALPGYALLKYSKSGEVARGRIQLNDRKIDVVLRQSRASGWPALPPWVRGTRERRGFQRAIAFLESGLDTAIPLAWMERDAPRREAWLVTEYLSGVLDLESLFLSELPRLAPARQRLVKRRVVIAVAELLLGLEREGWIHRDLKATNILVAGWDQPESELRTLIVDFDGLRRDWFRRWRRWHPIIRLLASLRSGHALTRTDFARFLESYPEDLGYLPKGWKKRFQWLDGRSAQYLRHAAKRKTGKLDAS